MTTLTTPPPPVTAPKTPPASPDACPPDTAPIAIKLPDAVVAAGPAACEGWFWAVCDANNDGLWQNDGL